MIHSLLQRQLRKSRGEGGALDEEALLQLVNQAYEEFDRSLRLQDQASRLMSDELNELNAAIRKERDEAVAQSQKRFELAVEGSNDGIWDWNVESDTLWLSSRCKAMLGYAPEDWKECRIEDWYAMVAPQDRGKARELIREHLNWRMRGSATLRLNHVSGDVRHIMFRAATMQDSYGRAARVVGIHTDVTPLIAMQEHLQAAKEVAESANRAKSDFLANMSHELRTPMHAILGFSRQALKRVGAAGDAKLAVMLSNIQVSGNRLLGLLNVLLDLSKLEAGKMDFEFVTDDIRKAISQTLLETGALIQAKEIRVTLHDEGASPIAPYDHKSMVQVFMNLLSNAIKFSPAGSEIVITLSESTLQTGKALLCSIRDYGIGIPEQELQLVFDKFVQSSKTRSGAGGTGLGLAIVQQIMEAHGGKVWAENAVPEGTCFHLLLPYDRKKESTDEQ